MKQLVEKQSGYVRPFIENINTVNKLYNQPMEMIIDKKTYISGSLKNVKGWYTKKGKILLFFYKTLAHDVTLYITIYKRR